MPRVKCTNGECKFNNYQGKCTKKSIEFDYNGCKSFEKNIAYYVHLVWDELKNTNMIFPFKLTSDLQIGLYYVMEFYGLKFKNNTWANDNFITLHKDGVKDGGALGYKDIISIDIDMEKLEYHMEKFNQGILPPYDEDKKNFKETKSIKSKVEYQPYGWLSPMGDFIESDFGTHEESAYEIAEKNHWEDEYLEWKKKLGDKIYSLYRDFICEVKGYALIHDPTNVGYIVTHRKELTKKQKEFLYSYFIDVGDYLRAEQYFND